MANEELKETISLTEHLNILEKEYSETGGKGNRTLKDRVAYLQEAVEFSDDNIKLGKSIMSL